MDRRICHKNHNHATGVWHKWTVHVDLGQTSTNVYSGANLLKIKEVKNFIDMHPGVSA
jgi:hypothetical protein